MSPWLLLATSCLAQDFTPVDAKTLRDAQTAVNEDRHEEAVQSLLVLQKKYPTESEIPRLLTHAYFGQNNFADARRMAVQSLGLGRVTQDVLVRLAQIDEERDDQTALLNTVRLLTIIDHDNHEWRVLYADLLIRANSLGEAVTVLRRLAASKPAAADVLLRLGDVFVKQKKLDEAAVALTTAYHLGASHERLPLILAGIWQELKDDREAQVWIRRAIDLSSKPSPKLSLQSARLLWDQGHAERASKVAEPLTKSVERDVRSQANLLLGHIKQANKQPEAAVGHWEQAVNDGAESVELLALLGAHYFNAAQHEKAAAMLKRVVDAEGADHEQHLRYLIISLIMAKSLPSAREYLVQYIERHGLNEKARELVRRLGTNG